MSKEQNTKRILIYLTFAFGIPWAAALVISLSGLMDNNPVQAGGLANTFFVATPWLANIVTRLVTKEGWVNLWLRPNFRRGWRFYLAVWVLPLLATFVGGMPFYLLFPQSFDPGLSAVQNLAASAPSTAVVSPWAILLSITLSIMIVSVPINTVASMGEEFGWRAYLLPKLIERFAGAGAGGTGVSTENQAQIGVFRASGARKAALLTGLIHGIWHWPLIIMTANLTPGASIFTPLVYLVFTSSLSILLSWATLRSGSVWPAAVGHGAINGTSALPGMLLKGPAIPLIGPDVTGLIGGIGYTILALALLISRTAFAGRKEAAPEMVETHPAAV